MEYTPLISNMKVNVRHFPLIIAITLLFVVIVTTFLAYYLKHITAVVPYISDTGTIPPESCIFGQALNIIWIQFSITMYFKYLQVKDILQKHNMTHKNSLNGHAFIVGLLAAFGVSIVGNFQETNAFIVHWLGAIMCFGLGSIYLCMQTSLYLAITPVFGQILLTKLRIVISVIAVATFLVFFVCAMISYSQFEGLDYLHWQPEEGGYEWHVTSAISEWICAISIITYLMLFKEEFKHTLIHEPVIETGLVKQSNPKRNSVNPGGPKKAF